MVKRSEKRRKEDGMNAAVGLRNRFIKLCKLGYFILATIAILFGIGVVCCVVVMCDCLVLMKMLAAIRMGMLHGCHRLIVVVVNIKTHIHA